MAGYWLQALVDMAPLAGLKVHIEKDGVIIASSEGQ
jgi:hypothetical protein